MTNTISPTTAVVASPTTTTKVVIIGNGPAGMSASAILAGWRPYYDAQHAHPSRHIHERLVDNLQTSIVEQDLSWWTDEGGLSKLLDVLVRPDADIGHSHPSSIRWKFEPEKAVDHFVLAKSAPGGSWHDYSQQLLSVSSNTWFDLPAVSMSSWLGGQPLIDRLPVAVVRQYFEQYPKRAGIKQYMRDRCQVHNVKSTHLSTHCGLQRTADCWTVEYSRDDDASGELLQCTAGCVVLASGLNRPKRLQVPGEDEHESVVHSVPAMEKLLGLDTSVNPVLAVFEHVYRLMDEDHANPQRAPATLCDPRVSCCRDAAFSSSVAVPSASQTSPVCIVGSGLSAADAVLQCLIHKIRVVHVFRKHPRLIKNSLLGRLNSTKYLDYKSIAALMTGKDKCDLYEPWPQHEVVSIDTQHETVHVRHAVDRDDQMKIISAQSVVVLIGSRVELPFLDSETVDVRNVDNAQLLLHDAATNQCVDRRSWQPVAGLYAAGPLVGNSFVRYIVGGSLLTARSVLQRCCSATA